MTSQPLMHRPWTLSVCAFLAYAVLAAAQAWPLPLHLSTHLTGAPGGDTGVYVWNLWIFKHQLVEAQASPFSTLEILPLDGPTDLSLHNYTVFANVIALPLLSLLGIVRTFNLIYLFNVTLAGFSCFLLARKLTRRPLESFLGGLLFMWAPYLVTRGQSHFSLVAIAPLCLFLLAVMHAWERRRLRDAAIAGLTIGWAAFCDPYYAVYCLMLGAAFVASRILDISVQRRPAGILRIPKRIVSVAIAMLIGLTTVMGVVGAGVMAIGPVVISMRTRYTPMLVLAILLLIRWSLSRSVRVRLVAPLPTRWLIRSSAVACLATALLMSPILVSLVPRLFSGGLVAAPVLWRSSAPGVDLVSFVIPNPNHWLSPAAVTDWLTKGPGGYADQVASLSIVGLLLMIVAWRFAGFRPPRFWLVITIGFGLLTLGPFVTIGRFETHFPTPWALLRYVPIIGAARMPARFDAVVILGFTMLVVTGLASLADRFPARRRLILTATAAGLFVELFPGPRTLYSAAVPKVYRTVAEDPRPVRVLRLPTGIRDGLSSAGNFGAQTQFYQTLHHKGLLGGYLSRVDPAVKKSYENIPVMAALIRLSEGQPLEPSQMDLAMATVDDFIRQANLGYVVWRKQAVAPELRAFATQLFGLTRVQETDGYELLIPRHAN